MHYNNFQQQQQKRTSNVKYIKSLYITILQMTIKCITKNFVRFFITYRMRWKIDKYFLMPIETYYKAISIINITQKNKTLVFQSR